MIKRILRAGMGVIFFFVFLLFLLVMAFKFRLLKPEFWKTALDKGEVYKQMQSQIEGSLSQSRGSVKKQGGTAGMSKEMIRLLYIDKELTAGRFKELVETNVDRLLGYVNGESRDLFLYLPVKEWNLPVAILKQPALERLTGRTSVPEIMAALGDKSGQVKPIIDGLKQIKDLVGVLTIVWAGLLAVIMGILAGHYFLGVGSADRIGGTAWLVMISGFVAKLIGVLAGRIFELIAVASKPPLPTWGTELGRSLVGQFFDLGATIGLGVGIAGLIMVIAAHFFIGKIRV